LEETAIVNLKKTDWRGLQMPDYRLIFLCPTYGDGELEQEFERFLFATNWDAHKGKAYAFAELGLYAGYEDFAHGLVPIIRSVLRKAGLRECVPPLSIDSVPMNDWPAVDAWSDLIRSSSLPCHE